METRPKCEQHLLQCAAGSQQRESSWEGKLLHLIPIQVSLLVLLLAMKAFASRKEGSYKSWVMAELHQAAGCPVLLPALLGEGEEHTCCPQSPEALMCLVLQQSVVSMDK